MGVDFKMSSGLLQRAMSCHDFLIERSDIPILCMCVELMILCIPKDFQVINCFLFSSVRHSVSYYLQLNVWVGCTAKIFGRVGNQSLLSKAKCFLISTGHRRTSRGLTNSHKDTRRKYKCGGGREKYDGRRFADLRSCNYYSVTRWPGRKCWITGIYQVFHINFVLNTPNWSFEIALSIGCLF